MTDIDIIEIILTCLKEYLMAMGRDNVEIDPESALLGERAILDSIGLVNLIIDIESRFLDEDLEITLASESAMSSRNSPFRSPRTLAAFIAAQIEENAMS